MSTQTQGPPAAVWRPKHNPWAIALTVTMATFMEVLDTSIANVALPHIAGDLSAGIDESTWVLTSYLVSNAVVLPISAWLATRFGRKRFYMACVILFGISSFLCGLAPSLSMLIVFRVIQGLGGGGLAPSEQAILADTFEPKKRGTAFALYGMAVVLAPAIGPTLGGFITDNYSWRWIFFINVPVALLSLFFTSRLVEDPPYIKEERDKVTSVDYIGLGLLGLGLGTLQVVLDKGEREDWLSSPFIQFFLATSVVSLITAIFWEWRQEHPILEIKLLKNRTFALSCVLMFTLGFALYGTTVLIPQLLQTLMGYTAQQSGEALSAGGFLIMMLMPLVGRLVSKYDARYMISFGFLVMMLALLHMTRLNLLMGFWDATMLRVYQSIGIAFLFVPINTMSYTGVPPEKNNSVSGMTNLMRNIGGSVGISLVSTLLSRRSQMHQNELRGNMTMFDDVFRSRVEGLAHTLTAAGVSAADSMQQAYARIYFQLQGQASVLAYIDTIWLFAIGCALMVPLPFLMRKNTAKGGAAMH